jgi:hypothetical protein
MALIKAQHAAGKRYEWNVTEPDVHISGNTAWIAYVNKGSVSDASGTKPEMVAYARSLANWNHAAQVYDRMTQSIIFRAQAYAAIRRCSNLSRVKN